MNTLTRLSKKSVAVHHSRILGAGDFAGCYGFAVVLPCGLTDRSRMNSKIVIATLVLVLVIGSFVGTAAAQEYSFGGDLAVVSKYIWRGQRLTNDWSMQPSMTMAIDGFSFNVWGTMDLMAVNEGTGRLLINENPATTGSGNNGLQGRFSEINYVFAYDHSFDDVSVGGGVIFYSFPDRFDTTTELYGTVGFDSVPLDPSVTLYVDVDETSAGNGDTGVYVNIAAGHSFGFNHDVFKGLDVGGSIAFANGGFGNFHYGIDDGGSHDASFTVSLPIAINDNWSAAGFVTYSSLLSGFRAGQFLDLRDVYWGTVGTPGSYSDTVWGGFNLSLSF